MKSILLLAEQATWEGWSNRSGWPQDWAGHASSVCRDDGELAQVVADQSSQACSSGLISICVNFLRFWTPIMLPTIWGRMMLSHRCPYTCLGFSVGGASWLALCRRFSKCHLHRSCRALCSCVTATAAGRMCPAAGQGTHRGNWPCGRSAAASAPCLPSCRFFRKDSLGLKVLHSRGDRWPGFRSWFWHSAVVWLWSVYVFLTLSNNT